MQVRKKWLEAHEWEQKFILEGLTDKDFKISAVTTKELNNSVVDKLQDLNSLLEDAKIGHIKNLEAQSGKLSIDFSYDANPRGLLGTYSISILINYILI